MKILSNKKYREIMDSVSSFPSISNDGAWKAYLTGNASALDATTAMQIAAVFRCVDLGSRTMAALPLHMFVKNKGGKEKAEKHRLYNLVYTLPNPATTAYEFWQMWFANLLLTKGAYAKIERDVNGFITALWNIPTNRCSGVKTTDSGERYIDVTLSDGKVERLMNGEFMYSAGFLFDNALNPKSPLALASKVLGLADDLNNFAAKSFNGALPGGYLEYPGSLSDKAYQRFKEDFIANYNGVMNAGKWMFLEQGTVAKRWDYDMEKSQVLESRKFAISEICRIFGIPPHLCMDMEHATFSNIEQQSLEFVRDFVNPMAVRTEQMLYRDLLTESEKKKYFFKFNVNGLLRGDTNARTAYYSSARQNGWLSANEIRALEDFNSLGEEGDAVYINGNMLPLSAAQLNLPKSAQNRSDK